MLGLIKRVFSVRNYDSFISLYKCFVRPILEFASLLWCPYHRYLINDIESVQRRFSKFFCHIRCLPYRERLSSLNLLSLSARRIRYKLIYMYKILNNHVDIDPDSFFSFARNDKTRGNKCKLKIQFANTNNWSNFFVNHVVKYWNKLSDDEIFVTNINAFKKSCELLFLREGIW